MPVLTESNGQFRILTRPVIFSEKVRPLGSRGDIGLYDFSQYVIGVRADASLDKSQHIGFRRNMTTYRLQLRVDGMPNISAPYTHRTAQQRKARSFCSRPKSVSERGVNADGRARQRGVSDGVLHVWRRGRLVNRGGRSR